MIYYQLFLQKIDNERVAAEAKSNGTLPLFKKHFETVQDLNLSKINEALNDLYIEEEDFSKLRDSIKHENFNQLDLAKKLESHFLLEFRRISAHLFRINKQYASSIDISKKKIIYIKMQLILLHLVKILKFQKNY